MKQKKKLVRQQLDATLKKVRPLLNISTPHKGWIRAIRDALGMNGRQLADRLDVTRQRAALIEKDELTGSVTLKTMRRVAECLDCVFVYGLVSRTSLEQTVRDQAKQVALQRLSRVSQTMRLEDQALSKNEEGKALTDMIEDLVDTVPSTLWDEL